MKVVCSSPCGTNPSPIKLASPPCVPCSART